MSGSTLSGLRPAQLRWRLLAFFAALAVPAALLFWLGFSRLNWEVYHQYRTQAEALTANIDRELADGVAALERLSFEDYAFVSGAADGVAQRSPIGGWPVDGALPGLVGYFQVDARGDFSTPIQPPAEARADALDISDEELAARRARAQEIRRILSDNRLVPRRIESRPGDGADAAVAAGMPASSPYGSLATLADALSRADDAAAAGASRDAAPAVAAEEADRGVDLGASGRANEGADPPPADYDQAVFDELNRVGAGRGQAGPRRETSAKEDGVARLSELRLDERLLQKSEQVERQKRARLSPASPPEPEAKALANRDAFGDDEALDAPGAAAPIEAFRRDIGGYELGVLGSGHLVLFRNAYRDGERFVQGALLARERFLDAAIRAPFARAGVSDVASLIVALGDDVLRNIAGATAAGEAGPDAASGTLLYRARLAAPLGDLALVYTLDRLPAGAGARVLVWTGVAFGLILAVGMTLLYRLGAGQIALARQQQDFVAAVSHELKTPLTSIRMYAEMLREGWVGEDRRAKYYRYIHDESERLTRLIANVLQLARITRNDAAPELRPLTVGKLLEEGEARIRSQVEHAGFELRMRLDPAASDDTVNADPDAVAQILINLVDNAIKFSAGAEPRAVEVGARRRGEATVELFVRDFGPGIAPEQMKKIFQLFYRPASELTRETAGTGIGLAIVRELAAAMGGSVDCVNRERGAEFHVALPRASGGEREG